MHGQRADQLTLDDDLSGKAPRLSPGLAFTRLARLPLAIILIILAN
jgi:hypothetical protein